MDNQTLDFLLELDQSVICNDWKKCLDGLFSALRQKFVFDNLAIYLAGKQKMPEVIYARALGRGRRAEADAAWGGSIASQVIAEGKIIRDKPVKKGVSDRVRLPYMIGLPLSLLQGIGALVFIRFGGPEYLPSQIKLASLIGGQVSRILERRLLSEQIAQLDIARHYAQLQDDFIATISHDIHTPLGFIKGYTTTLLRSDTTWDSETQKEFLTIIDEETDHLMGLMDHLLDSARLKNGVLMMDFQPVRLDSLIKDVVVRVCTRNKDIHVEQDFVTVPPILADTVRLSQVFDNLFDNAMKYAPGSKIIITLRESSDYLNIIFTDNGPGISPEHLPFLFERFYRIPVQSGERGTGLGLFICREIIRAHNGQISVDTAPGKGTAFLIRLPFTQSNK